MEHQVFATIEEFEAWMEENHAVADEVWVPLAKKGTDVPSITRDEALDVALCYGWIDGKSFSGSTPEGWWAQRFSPRRKRTASFANMMLGGYEGHTAELRAGMTATLERVKAAAEAVERPAAVRELVALEQAA